MSDDNVERYQLPSHQLELPVVLAQDSIASIESVVLRIGRVSVRIRIAIVNLRLIRRALGRLEEPWADWRSLGLTGGA